MSKILSPKAWYLVGIGAVALVADGARRLVKRRRQMETAQPAPNQPEQVIPVTDYTPPSGGRASTKPAPAATRADDLTAIKGIGPTFAKRLNDAGIMTFAALAAATPEQLREVTRAPAVANPEEWIAQARSM